jgi:hypothetical protein
VILGESGSPQPGSHLAFLVRIQTVDPSAFEIPDAPARSRGFFIFRFWHIASFRYAANLVAIGGIADIAKHHHRKLFGATYLQD